MSVSAAREVPIGNSARTASMWIQNVFFCDAELRLLVVQFRSYGGKLVIDYTRPTLC